jgi:hypothetical protein
MKMEKGKLTEKCILSKMDVCNLMLETEKEISKKMVTVKTALEIS